MVGPPNALFSMRDHPIPPVTEPLQYRAIGIVRGTYVPESLNHFTRGRLVDESGEELEAVVLGRVMTLMKRHIEMDKSHLWVVYPRSRTTNHLHLQVAGIWEPSSLGSTNQQKEDLSKSRSDKNSLTSDELPEGDNYFSIRGELIFTKPETEELIIKIRQKPRDENSRALPFKLNLKGNLPFEHLRHFVSLEVRRERQQLRLEKYDVIGPMPTRGGKKRPGKYENPRKKNSQNKPGLDVDK